MRIPNGLTRAPGTLSELLRLRAERQGEREAFTFLPDDPATGAPVMVTYGDMHASAGRIAAELLAAGIGRGERVMLLYPPGPDYVNAFFGCLYVGVVAVPVYPPDPRRWERGVARLVTVARDARPRGVLTTAAIAGAARELLAGQAAELAALDWLSTDDLSARPDDGLQVEANADGLAFLQYTSGSTSDPRGVRLTHANLLHNLGMIGDFFEVDADSRGMVWLPPYHDMGLIGGILGPVHGGFPVTLMSPMAFLADPLRWPRAVSDSGATASGGPNFAFELCARRAEQQPPAGLDLSTWQVAFCGAEPIRSSTLDRFVAAFEPYGFRREAIYPCYGLAEATLIATGGARAAAPVVREFAADDLAEGRAVPEEGGRPLVGCGTAADDQGLCVVDPATRIPVPDGAVGEVWLRGPSVAEGYWHAPESTAGVFGARLAGVATGDSWLRTGDLAFVAGGELFVTGRRKDLIVVRGRNHYPHDIELTAETSHPALRPGGAAAFGVVVDDVETVVVVQEVRRGHDDADLAAVSREVRGAITDTHGLAVHDVVLVPAGAVPKTSSGKVRRSACREAYLADELPRLDADPVIPPRDPVRRGAHSGGGPAAGVRRRVCELLAGVVGTPADVLATDVPLPALGLDSLGAVDLAARLRDELGTDVPVSLLLGGTVDEVVDALGRGEPPAAGRDAAGVPGSGTPMTAGQRALWFVQQLEPVSTAYLISRAVEVDGHLDATALRAAFATLVARHEALRTCFPTDGDEPVARVVQDLAPDFAEHDAADLSPGELDAELVRAAYEPFDLATGPLLRVRLFRVTATRHVLVLAAHHLIVDLWSLSMLVSELTECYAAHRRGDTVALPDATAFSDFARWQEQAGRARWDADERHWRTRLAAPLPVLSLPGPAMPPGAGAGVARFVIHPHLVARAARYANEHGTTAFAVLLAAYTALLHQLSGQDDVVVGTPVANRDWPGSASFAGYAVNPVAIRTDLSAAPDFADLVTRTAAELRAALDHRDLPFPELVARLRPHRTIGRQPVFQTMFLLQHVNGRADESLSGFALDAPDARLVLDDLAVTSHPLPALDSQFDLTFALAPRDGALLGRIEYESARLDPAVAADLGDRYSTLLRAALDAPGTPVTRLSGLTDVERQLTLHTWNETDLDVPDRCLHELVAEQAARTPHAPALRHGDEVVSYADLDARADRMAAVLLGRGVGVGDRVAVFLRRGPDLVTGLLAVLKAGAAYVPLDPRYPHARTAAILSDAGAALVLTESGLRADLPATDVPLLLVDDVGTGGPPRAPRRAPRQDDVAYLLFTSGSTGRPKGVAIAHRGAVNLVAWALSEFDRADLAGVLAATSVAFDLSVFEMFVPLACGGTVILAEDALALAGLPARHEVTLVNTVPSAVEELLDNGGLPRTVRVVNLAGEPLRQELVDRVNAAGGPDRVVYNLYGPSETTTYSTFVRVSRESGVSIGRPVGNTRVFVLDGGLSPAPVGVCGELFIGGLGVGLGYWGRGGLTAACFVPDVFDGGGGRLYRTGDVVRWRSDGCLEFVGRVDFQVKVRGFRVELGEVESVVRAAGGVRAAVVVVVGAGASARLVGCVVPAGGAGGDGFVGDVLQFCRGRLPEYMVPSGWVVLDELPLTPNGKVDRRRLPVDGVVSGVVAGFVAPVSEVECRVAGVWGELLGVSRVGLADNFFDLGGHSLLAARMARRLRAECGLDVAIGLVFDHPVLADFVAALDVPAARTAPVGRLIALPRAADRGYESRATDAQERLWFLQRLDPDAGRAYHLHGVFRMAGPVDRVALQRALNDVVARQHSLKSRFVRVGAELRQIVDPHVQVVVGVADMRGVPAARRDEAVRAAASEQGRRPFRLDSAPLLRVTLFRLGQDEHLLAVTTHHIVSDGWSVEVLLEALTDRYRQVLAGDQEQVVAGPLPQFADYANWLRDPDRRDRFAVERDYWTNQLADLPDLVGLPTDRPRPPVQEFAGATHRFAVPVELVRALRQRCRDDDVTLYMATLTAWLVVLSRHADQDDFGVGTPVANRPHPELEQLVGFFANTVVIRADLSGGPTVREVLQRVRATCLAAYANSELPFEEVVAALHPHRTPDRSPLFQVMFGLHDATLGQVRLGEAILTPVPDEVGAAKFDLSLFLAKDGERLEAMIEYRTTLFDEETVRRHEHHFLAALATVAREPECQVDRVPLLPHAERRMVTEDWNATALPVPEPLPVPLQLAAQAARTPSAVAVTAGEHTLTYERLGARVEDFRRTLHDRGVRPGDRVAVCLRRGADLVAALLGVLACGAAYVPLDPRHPADRLRYVVDDADPRLVLVDDDPPFDCPGPVLRVSDVDSSGVPADPATWCAGLRAEDPAYLIYTSGSTGRPKGVVVHHGALANFLAAMRAELPLEGRRTLVAVTTPSFDIAALELFLPLTIGHRVVVASAEQTWSGAELAALLAETGASVMQATPVTWRMLLDAGWDCPDGFLALCGGEALPRDLAADLLAAGARLWNLYGPTETTIWSCATEITQDTGVSIGRPVANTRVFVVDGGLSPVPVGVCGELLVGGSGVASGYWGRAGLTASRFVPDVFGGGGRLYRTGDVVRWRSDGCLEFVGRADFQVKVRGFRVELGEVESVVRAAGGVRAAVVVVVGSGVSARLVGFVVPADGVGGDGFFAGVLEFCRGRLPEYMVPSGWVVLDELPVTPNGKVDRGRLPLDGIVEGVAADFVAPVSDVEHRVAAVWRELLEVTRVGLADSFFDLGGHSLLVARMVDEIRREFGVDIPIRDVFLDATLAAVAASVGRAMGSATTNTGADGADDKLLDDLARLPMTEFEAVLAESAPMTSEDRI